jgi:CheY-like chemotaxis protein
MTSSKTLDILVVEDSPSDAKLMMHMLKMAKLQNNVSLVRDGAEAMAFLKQQPPYEKESRPDLILLDLNLPKMNGFEVLEKIKTDPVLKVIPVVVMTTSNAEEDVIKSYEHFANCYVTKPVDFEQFMSIVQTIDSFWFSIVKLPPKDDRL